MLCHHLRWQKFLQQIAIKQQRQGSSHTACCSSNLSTHSSKSQPCSWNGCQIHPLVGTEHRNSLPHTLCSRVCQGITSSQCCDSTQAPFPCSRQTEDPPTPTICIPGIYRGAAGHGDLFQICISS